MSLTQLVPGVWKKLHKHTVIAAHLKPHCTYCGPDHGSVKGQRVNISGFSGPKSVTTTQLCRHSSKAATGHVNEQAWLCSNNTLLVRADGGSDTAPGLMEVWPSLSWTMWAPRTQTQGQEGTDPVFKELPMWVGYRGCIITTPRDESAWG